ncbi:MAG TPA: hypothetical protein VIO11_06170 [Candidatus Methanoperedens sp.]
MLREFNRLMDEARKLGIQSPEDHYNEGKTKGRSSRDKGIGEAAGKKLAEKATYSKDTLTDQDESKDEYNVDLLVKKPSMSNIPDLLEKISMVEIPKLIYGLRFLHKK